MRYSRRSNSDLRGAVYALDEHDLRLGARIGTVELQWAVIASATVTGSAFSFDSISVYIRSIALVEDNPLAGSYSRGRGQRQNSTPLRESACPISRPEIGGITAKPTGAARSQKDVAAVQVYLCLRWPGTAQHDPFIRVQAGDRPRTRWEFHHSILRAVSNFCLDLRGGIGR